MHRFLSLPEINQMDLFVQYVEMAVENRVLVSSNGIRNQNCGRASNVVEV